MNLTITSPPYERLMIKLKPVSFCVAAPDASVTVRGGAGQHVQAAGAAGQRVSFACSLGAAFDCICAPCVTVPLPSRSLRNVISTDNTSIVDVTSVVDGVKVLTLQRCVPPPSRCSRRPPLTSSTCSSTSSPA